MARLAKQARSKRLVELNGKLYDAVTGQVVDAGSGLAAKSKPTKAARSAAVAEASATKPKPVQISDVARPVDVATAKPASAAAKPAAAAKSVAVKPAAKTRERAASLNRSAKPVQKSKTLMRSAVRKPQKVHKPAVAKPSPVAKPVVSTRSQTVPARRLSHATTVSRSAVISKFGTAGYGGPKVAVELKSLPVQAPPIAEPMPRLDHRLKPVSSTTKAASVGSRHTNRPSAAPARVTTRPVPTAHVASAVASKSAPATGAKAAPAKRNNFQAALNNATSHQQTKLPRQSRTKRARTRARGANKLTKLATVTASVFILGGFYLVNNLPNLSVRIAAARADVGAAVPDYQPAGFTLSRSVEYAPGKIGLRFNSNSDKRYFALTQRETAKDEQTLLRERASQDDQSYYTLEYGGKLIFVYGDDRAAWLQDGKWFELIDRAALSSDQLLKVIGSVR